MPVKTAIVYSPPVFKFHNSQLFGSTVPMLFQEVVCHLEPIINGNRQFDRYPQPTALTFEYTATTFDLYPVLEPSRHNFPYAPGSRSLSKYFSWRSRHSIT